MKEQAIERATCGPEDLDSRVVGRSFRNANRPTVLGELISLGALDLTGRLRALKPSHSRCEPPS